MKSPARRFLPITVLVVSSLLSACASDGPPSSNRGLSTADAVPKDENLSPYGNRPYQVNGVWYSPLRTAKGYRQRGVASWYGSKFHGRLTSSREPYDMYAMTAAHKTLPLPSYVRVTNLKTGESAVVRVNDRGPFHDDRIIDLSYAAAHKLGIDRAGTGLVEVEGIVADEYSPREGPGQELARASLPPPPEPATHPPLINPGPYAVTPSAPLAGIVAAGSPPHSSRPTAAGAQIYIQIGAFSQRASAENLARSLERDYNVMTAITPTISANGLTLHRVRLGPIPDVTEADSLMARLNAAHLGRPILVVE